MKKIFTLAVFIMTMCMTNYAQNYLELSITQIDDHQELFYCDGQYDSIRFLKDATCQSNPYWIVSDIDGGSLFEGYANQVSISQEMGNYFDIYYNGCGVGKGFTVIFFDFGEVEEPWAEDCVWKRIGESITLWVGWENVNNEWSTGATGDFFTVINPGTYWVHMYNQCGELWDTIQVRDNVEIYRATIDLETNLNKVTWQTTPEQAEYISEVKAYRDGLLVGTAPYEQGYFLDAIGSDNAARNYQLVGVTPEGEECPIASYEKGTIHTTYYQDVNNNLNMTWNIPYVEEGAQGMLTYFQICKYDPNTDEITVVDQVNASITDYTCGVNQFDGGYAVIAAVFNDGKGLEELSFSNLTTDILGIGENAETAFRVYPNPAKDHVTVEGTGILTVTNALGQTILSKEIDGKTTIDLPQGMYFVKLNGITRKIVVE
jgi:hypothetical protein